MASEPAFRELSHYRLIEPIGRGGMGEVWLADDTLLPRRVAIKVLHAQHADDRSAVERLLREARAAATIDHPHVVTVYDAGVHQGQPFLVMPYVEGETLQQRLGRGRLPPAEAIAIVRAIADALAEVHALGIVHRDLKPCNVMLTTRGPRILDFGVSAMRGDPRLTATGTALGTPLAMSPEQFAGRPADNRSDLWALGVMLYETLTGVHPFAADHYEAVAHRVLHEQPPPPSALNRTTGEKLDLVVGKLLRKDPALRYARAEEVLADLADVTRDAGGAAPRAAAEPRLAVLYFEVLSPDPDDEALAAGLTEDLIVDLARVGGLRVSGRGEVLPYRDRALPPRTVARELGAEFVVQGSVRRAGSRARISAQLVRASDGHAAWAERFDRTLEDLFDVQAEVSKRIVEALAITLRPAERELLARAPSRNREAYAFYLRGRALADDPQRSSMQGAEQCFRQAIALDPDFALAHAALAEMIARAAGAWWVPPEMLETAQSHARQAVAIDDALPEAHVALGMIHYAQGHHAEVLASLEAAHKLDSNDPLVMLWVGNSYMRLGRPEEALAIVERALQLRPRDYRLLSVYSDSNDMLGRKDVVAATLRRMRDVCLEVLERAPDNNHCRSMFSIVLTQLGEAAEGVAQAERALAADPGDGRVMYNAACTFAHAGEHDRAIATLRELVRTHPGFPIEWPRRDPDFAMLRDRPDFLEALAPAGTQRR